MIKQGLAAIALIALVPTQIAHAASLEGPRLSTPSRAGMFAGPRLRVSFGGRTRARAQGGFALAGTQTTIHADGSRHTRMGEGLWLGLGDHGTPALSIAGRPVGDTLGGKRRNGLSKGGSTGLLIAGGVLVAAVAGYLYFDHVIDNEDE